MILKGRISIITGGSGGIGKAIAAAYAREGASLVLVSRTGAELEKTQHELAGPHSAVEIYPADVSREEDVGGLLDFTLGKFGTVDILVNCAGVQGPIGPVTDIDEKEWFEAIKINLYGTFLCIRAVLPVMIRKNSGKILNFSGGGAVSPRPRFSAYGTSKAGVVRLTETLAAELKEYNISVHAIAPGAVNTRMLELVLAAGEAAGKEEMAKALKQKREGGVPPPKVAELAVFLASDRSDGLSGRLISLPWDNWAAIPQHVPDIMSSDIFAMRRIIPKDRGYAW
jgi:NAD(P)-dependent dehydrogenase (short-subunit alcohol dehydrogenase family)